ncbi:MAG: Trk family potassium uptake protein [Acidobacteriota bacterium]|nr:MAG: Trk family potassium uptake protein [Acidobacteriota bacterium]
MPFPTLTLSRSSLASEPRLGGNAAGKPLLLILGSYLVAIFLGTVLLTLPVSSVERDWTHPLDALFTATSAVCVTGLIVVDTPTHFSGFGKLVIMCLIQAGGWSIIVLSTLVTLFVGRSILLRHAQVIRSVMGSLDTGSVARESLNIPTLFRVLKTIVVITLGIEAVGVAVLSGWFLHLGYSPAAALAYGLFHTVSSFCNAGFALYSDSMVRFQHDPVVGPAIALLVYLGSIGYIVYADLWRWLQSRLGRGAELPHVLSLHSKLVLTVSLTVIGTGALLIMAFEAGGTMLALGAGEKVNASLFTALMATAGFNIVPTEALSEASLFVLMVLMFIGGSSLSAAGGIKTTTFAVMFLTLRSIVRQTASVTVFRRRITTIEVRRSIAIVFMFLGAIVVGTLALLVTEGKPFLPVVFEVMSAIGTVGLSMGITGGLTPPGKTIIIALMVMGRVGPLAMVLLAAGRGKREVVQRPAEPIMVG